MLRKVNQRKREGRGREGMSHSWCGWVLFIVTHTLFKPIGQQIGMQGLMVIILSKLS